jgi:hypothetical protein
MSTDFGRCLFGFMIIDIGDRDSRAFARQRHAHRFADSAGTARYDCNFVAKTHVEFLLYIFQNDIH